jgi:hypothetical protein
MSENHEINISGVPEQNTRVSLEGLTNREVRNPNKEVALPTPDCVNEINPLNEEGASGSASNPSTDSTDVRDAIAAAFCHAFTNCLVEQLGPGDYRGHCWVPLVDFDAFCKVLSEASIISVCGSVELLSQWQEVMKIGEVTVFAIMHDAKSHRVMEVSGQLLLLSAWNGADVVLTFAGMTDFNVMMGRTRPFFDLSDPGAFFSDDLVLLYGVPDERDSHVLFEIGKTGSWKVVRRGDTERKIKDLLRKAEGKESRKKKRTRETAATCDFCGQTPAPEFDSDVTGVPGPGGRPLGPRIPTLNLVGFEGERLWVCNACKDILEAENAAA